MDKRKKLRLAVELGKDVLIVLLSISALWMLGRSGRLQGLELSGEQSAGSAALQSDEDELARAARPLQLTVTLAGGENPMRCTLRHDEGVVDTVFHQVAGFLMEALSSGEAPEPVSREEWERALRQAPGFCFDFQGEMPLSVLAGWLDGRLSVPDATVRRVVLTAHGDSVALYYYDLQAESWYCCDTQVVSDRQLAAAVEGLSPDGTFYAFEREETAGLDPDTVLVPSAEELPVYGAANPAAGGRSVLEELMEELGFKMSGCVFYSAAGEEVARSGSDTVRLSNKGVLEYAADAHSAAQFPVSTVAGESEVWAAVESCRQLAETVTRERRGEARLYLSRAKQSDNGWEIEFEYCLNGVPVSLRDGPAAAFSVSAGHITGFALRLRSYTADGTGQLILPPVQAAAAMGALELEGREMQLMYRDRGEETVVPNWTAAAERVR